MRAWDYTSGVLTCSSCDGTGWINDDPYHTHPNDPDTSASECADCEGRGFIPCAVCGFEVRITGFDCLACFTAAELPANINQQHFGAALACALTAKGLSA